MDVLKEDMENRAVYLSTPKREKSIKVFWPRELNEGMWRITYEDGAPVAAELSGKFTTKRDAIKALNTWEEATSATSCAKYKGKEPPVLKRKNSGTSNKDA